MMLLRHLLPVVGRSVLGSAGLCAFEYMCDCGGRLSVVVVQQVAGRFPPLFSLRCFRLTGTGIEIGTGTGAVVWTVIGGSESSPIANAPRAVLQRSQHPQQRLWTPHPSLRPPRPRRPVDGRPRHPARPAAPQGDRPPVVPPPVGPRLAAPLPVVAPASPSDLLWPWLALSLLFCSLPIPLPLSPRAPSLSLVCLRGA